jgi:hypothetical protein
LGEFPTAGSQITVSEYLEKAWSNNLAGALAWSFRAGDTSSAEFLQVHPPFEDWRRAHPDVPVDVRTFADIGCTHWAFPQIEAVHLAGVAFGYLQDDGGTPDSPWDDTILYRPEEAVTRDQMAVYIARAMVGGDANVPDQGCSTPLFTDVSCDYWARKYIQYAVSQVVVEGYPEGDYKPDMEVTRDQMAVYVARSIATPTGEAGLDEYVPATPRNFPDVPSDFWAYKHVEYCIENGVVQGYDDGMYHPEWWVTRDQMAVYVARAFHLPV